MKETIQFGKEIDLINGERDICNVVAIIRNVETGEEEIIYGANIVTNNGDQYYAEAAVGSPSWAVVGMRMGTSITAVGKSDTDVNGFLAGSGKNLDATFPKTGDTDADNTGAGVDVVTWTVSYTTAQGNGVDIAELALVDSITSPTKALTHALFSALFTKTSSDTLKVIVNHTFNGV